MSGPVYESAIRLLWQRDHSERELRRKLEKRYDDDDAINRTVEVLTHQRYLDDRRFAERYAGQLLGRGYGPLLIKAKLREKGIEDALIQDSLCVLSPDWAECADIALRRRFSEDVILDVSSRNKGRIARYLSSRGYSHSDALRAYQRAYRDLNDR